MQEVLGAQGDAGTDESLRALLHLGPVGRK